MVREILLLCLAIGHLTAAITPPPPASTKKTAKASVTKVAAQTAGKSTGKKPATPARIANNKTTETKDTTPADPNAYRISVDDVLAISVIDRPELNQNAIVLPDGTINYNYAGEIKVVGLTLKQLTIQLTTVLKKQYVRPQVTITVTQRQQRIVGIVGNGVRSGGSHQMRDGWRVLNAIIDSGGLTAPDRPEFFSATLYHRDDLKGISIDLTKIINVQTVDESQNPLLETGDLLAINELGPEKTTVTVQGEITRPGFVPLPRDGSLVAVVNAAGGPTLRAALSRSVIRRDGKEIPIDLRSLNKKGAAPPDTTLQAGDTLFIPENKNRYYILAPASSTGPVIYPDDEKLTAFGALVRGGFQPQAAKLQEGKLVRQTDDPQKPKVFDLDLREIQKGDFSKDMPIQPDDVIFVPSKDAPKKGFGFYDALGLVPFLNYFRR